MKDKPPVPEILRGHLDGNNAEQVKALRAYERLMTDWQDKEAKRAGLGHFLVEVPVTGFRVYGVLAADRLEAEVMVAEGEGELVADEVEEERDCARVERECVR